MFKITLQDGTFGWIQSWVDDILGFAPAYIQKAFGDSLKEKNRITGGEQISTWLNANFKYDVKAGILEVDQNDHIDRYIAACGLPGTDDTKPTATPMDVDWTIDEVHEELENRATAADSKKYRKCVGMLLYISSFTAPELSIVTSLLSRYVKNPPKKAIKCLRRIGRYLIGRKKIPFTICRNSRSHIGSGTLNDSVYNMNDAIIAGSDATWNSFPDGTFTYGFVVMILGNIVSYRAKKSTIIGLSTFECETIALSECTREVLYFRNLLEELGYKQTTASRVFGDNASAILHTKDRKQTDRSKHIRLKHCQVRSEGD